jgi:hypothetical protein
LLLVKEGSEATMSKLLIALVLAASMFTPAAAWDEGTQEGVAEAIIYNEKCGDTDDNALADIARVMMNGSTPQEKQQIMAKADVLRAHVERADWVVRANWCEHLKKVAHSVHK